MNTTTEQKFAWVELDPDGNPMNAVVTGAGGVTMMNRHLDTGHTSTVRPARPGETTSDLIAETFPPDPTATARHLMTIRLADL
jgi:hypothetical protein